MKTLILSSIIALSAAFATIAPAEAATVTVTTTTQQVNGHRDHRDRDYRSSHRRPVVQRCFYKTERHERHNRMVVTRTKVCR